MEYIRGSRAPECIFHNKHKTLYNLFSPDPAVSCVADKVLHREIYMLCSSFLHFMGHMDIIRSILLGFLFNII